MKGKMRRRNVAGRRIRQQRNFEGLNQSEFSQILTDRGVEMKGYTLSEIEIGNRVVTDIELNEIAQMLNVDIYWLLGIAERPGKYGVIEKPIQKNYWFKIGRDNNSDQ